MFEASEKSNMGSDRVKLNVGGKLFETTRATLEQGGESLFLLPLISPTWTRHESGSIPEIFIDRDPKIFRILLNLLRTGAIDLPQGLSLQALADEADYYGLLNIVKGASSPPQLDANEMEKVRVVRPNVGSAEVCTMEAGQDGSLDVAHGSRITCYDWNLQRTRTIITDIPQVDAIQRLSSTHIMTGGSRSGDNLAVYDVRNGTKSQTVVCGGSHAVVKALEASDKHVYVASLRHSLGLEWGTGKAVGIIDKHTLQVAGEFGSSPVTTRRISGPDKLRWVESMNLLLVARRYAAMANSEDPSYARLWDPRANLLVWDWREFDAGFFQGDPWKRPAALCDVDISEELHLLFKVSPYTDLTSCGLSAVDLRKLKNAGASGPTLGHEQWLPLEGQLPQKPGRQVPSAKVEYRPLRVVAVPGSRQLVCNMQSTIEVWSPHLEDEGSSLPQGQGGLHPAFSKGYTDAREQEACTRAKEEERAYPNRIPEYRPKYSWICDMVLGGDRLFMTRESDKNAIEVWETRSS